MKHIHIIGIGGIGISALAQAYFKKGYSISGSDICVSELTLKLEKIGIKIYYKHAKTNIPQNTTLIVYSEAIDQNNPELKKAIELKIPSQTYFEALGELSKEYYTIAVAGTHGKTTTTAMLAKILIDNNYDPNVIIGSTMPEFDNLNYRYGKSKYFIIEACEYRESFLHLHPNMILITNCELDHLDYYQDLKHYQSAFTKFVAKTPTTGYVIIPKNESEKNPMIKKATTGIFQTVLSSIPVPKLNLPGKHNQDNARLALIAANTLGIFEKKSHQSLQEFKGVWRRFEKIGEINQRIIYDDYAHHPTEIKATLHAAKKHFPKNRIICIFQPHQYSRTHFFLTEFSSSFKDADIIIIPNIYEARDSIEDKTKVNVNILVQSIRKNNQTVYNGHGFNKTIEILNTVSKPNDIIITMGAGDVWEIGQKYLHQT